MPRFLTVLDVDSTLIEDEVIELLADAAGARDEVAAITERAMAGELDFAESLHARVATLAGLPSTVFADAAARIRLTAGVPELVAGLHAHGSVIGVVSGGFHEVLDPIAESLGLDFWRANRLEVVGGALTGRVDGPVVDAAGKAAALREWAEEAGVAPAHTVAVGDGANDLLMMDAAALSVAFNAKPRVRDHADVVVTHCDLSQVLPLLGLRG
ncbi:MULTISPECIES: phosphoserine phosphatase SerB [unclassified Frigoribacterium]|uniref:phosphoserine phosphatase SerB n=1 Tax=unclassified Frigoribacterium TaxID=2627005 RepID=UPI000F46ED14|nr:MULTISPECIES: phosphoserine phosphatase SerB [unclassified Frigoribacterium]ROP77680.1 phosphoserine phosphatase [Frigoribacterium sp. PhB107]TDT65521.1 phosphoserine phosphatase [Frigoribacterium sp. PhB116]